MITETELQYLTKAYEAGRKARFAVRADKAWLALSAADSSVDNIPVPISSISKFLALTVVVEEESSADNSITYYALTSRAFQVVDNPENAAQLTAALFF